jgi:hypothetical protein
MFSPTKDDQMPSFCYTAAAPSVPVPLTLEEREQLITLNMAESEDDADCFSAIASARRKAVDGRDAQRLLKLAQRGLL